MPASRRLGVALVGHAFMGRAHSLAWQRAGQVFDGLPAVELVALCGRDREQTEAAARRFGFGEAASDWRALLERADVDVVDVCTPGSSHAEISIAALRAGKHVLCEKPLANSLEEARAMAAAADEASAGGVFAMAGFNYRRVPALAHARQIVAQGRLGVVRHVRAVYLQDWLVDPSFPLTWRLRREEAGSGALGDLGSHIVDLAQHLLGEPLAEVAGTQATFVPRRPLAASASGLAASGASGPLADVTVDDAVAFVGRFASGALGTFEASRMASGCKNALRIEVNGSLASVRFDIERLNELEICDDLGPEGGFRRVLVTEPSHPYLEAWWPPGHVLGWEHTFVHEVADFASAIAASRQPQPSFANGAAVQAVLDAVARAAEQRAWVDVPASV